MLSVFTRLFRRGEARRQRAQTRLDALNAALTAQGPRHLQRLRTLIEQLEGCGVRCVLRLDDAYDFHGTGYAAAQRRFRLAAGGWRFEGTAVYTLGGRLRHIEWSWPADFPIKPNGGAINERRVTWWKHGGTLRRIAEGVGMDAGQERVVVPFHRSGGRSRRI